MLENLKPIFNKTLRPIALALAKVGIHPNHVTFLGLLFFCVAGYLAIYNNWKIALLFVIGGGLLDGLDGVLARETGKKSTFGAILDSSCDRLTEIVLLLGIMAFYLFQIPVNILGAILCSTAISGSLMVSYVKARCEGESVPCHSGILQRPERLVLISIGLLSGPGVMIVLLGAITVFGIVTSIQRLFEAARYCRGRDARG